MTITTKRILAMLAITILVSSCCCRNKLFVDKDEVDESLAGIFDEIENVETHGGESGKGGSFTGEKVRVEFYVMSQCPYGAKVQQGIAPVLAEMGDYIDFSQDFIASEKVDEIKCMHGEDECQGNIAQLCAAQHFPEKYFPMVVCMADDMSGIPGNWSSCATESNLDTEVLEACITGPEGEKLLRESLKYAMAREAKGSPTMYIDDVQYNGARTAQGFETAICLALSESQRPATCPAITPVNLTVISDTRCVDCPKNVERTLKNLESIFPGLEVEHLDWSDAEAKTLAQTANVERLPGFVFETNIIKSSGWDDFKKHVDSAGGYYVISASASRSKFDPTAEICDNGVDDTGDGLVDCDSDGCSSALPCREEIAGRLDLFLMSDCPHCKKAMSAIPAVLKKFKKRMELKVHFITGIYDQAGYDAYSKKDRCKLFGTDMWLCSLHGQAETEENMRQLCAQQLYPKKNRYLDYVSCRHADFDGDWKACADKSKVKADDIDECASGIDGLSLLKDDNDLTTALSISASPTFLWNNKVIELPKQYTVEGISATFCTHNPGKGCK